jgi:hypothetical protein
VGTTCALLACAAALAHPSPAAAAPLASPHSQLRAPAGHVHGTARLVHQSTSHGGGHGRARAASPAPQVVQHVTFDNSAGVAVQLGNAVTAAPHSAPLVLLGGLPPAIAGPGVGDIFSVPQHAIGGATPGAPGLPGDLSSDVGVWQVIATAEGVALVALVAALARRRRTAGRHGR